MDQENSYLHVKAIRITLRCEHKFSLFIPHSPFTLRDYLTSLTADVILIVDDYPDTCRALQRLLEKMGYRVECVTSGPAAMDITHTVRPNLIILDNSMPGMDGLQVLRELRNDEGTRDVPVLFYSAMADPQLIEQAKALGADDWVVKGTADWMNLLGKVSSLYAAPT
jgi:CheY-like chemotaxis protein